MRSSMSTGSEDGGCHCAVFCCAFQGHRKIENDEHDYPIQKEKKKCHAQRSASTSKQVIARVLNAEPIYSCDRCILENAQLVSACFLPGLCECVPVILQLYLHALRLELTTSKGETMRADVVFKGSKKRHVPLPRSNLLAI